ncbi:hypothetical protein B0G84_4647 [Paraburkholderia sp. BL8N3]|nr:hypothetical protein B0G84_4647 [Paraburkholderia sp. BL8N3]
MTEGASGVRFDCSDRLTIADARNYPMLDVRCDSTCVLCVPADRLFETCGPIPKYSEQYDCLGIACCSAEARC